MIKRDTARDLVEYACNRISKDGGIPRTWLTYYLQFDICSDQMMVRIDCMEVMFSTRMRPPYSNLETVEKLMFETYGFMMLLWGETA